MSDQFYGAFPVDNANRWKVPATSFVQCTCEEPENIMTGDDDFSMASDNDVPMPLHDDATFTEPAGPAPPEPQRTLRSHSTVP